MDDEFQTFSFSHLLTAMIAIAFGWGAFWAGGQGVEIAFNSQNMASNVASANDAIAMPVETSPAAAAPAQAQAAAPAIPSPAAASYVTVTIGGDVMFDRTIRTLASKIGYENLLSEVAPIFKASDISVVNLEGPVTSNKSKTLVANKATKSFTFTFDPKSVKALTEAGINLVSLANNHSDNFGSAGLGETKKWLDAVDIDWFGSPANASSTEFVVTKNGIAVAFVGYHAFQKGYERVLASIKKLSDEGDFVIVMPHWGEEYASSTFEALKAKTNEMIIAGADAIIGSHPHVIMEHKMVGSIPVFYSLGNLLFDQYFNPEVMRGEIVQMKLSKVGETVSIDSIKLYETSLSREKGVTLVGEKTF